MGKVYYVRTGQFDKDGYFDVFNDLHPVEEEIYLEACKELEGYLIGLQTTYTRSYDDSDDERVENETRTYYKTSKYREINPITQSESMLFIDNKIVGVVYMVDKGKNSEQLRAFLFDGKIAQSMRLGWSASHSSSFEYVDRIILVKKGEDGAPLNAKEANFFQSGMYPSL